MTDLINRTKAATRQMNSIMVQPYTGKIRHLKLYFDADGHPYVRTGKRGQTKEMITGSTTIMGGENPLYLFTSTWEPTSH